MPELGNLLAVPEDGVRVSFASRESDLWPATLYVTIHRPPLARLIIVPFVVGLIYALIFHARGIWILVIFGVAFIVP